MQGDARTTPMEVQDQLPQGENPEERSRIICSFESKVLPSPNHVETIEYPTVWSKLTYATARFFWTEDLSKLIIILTDESDVATDRYLEKHIEAVCFTAFALTRKNQESLRTEVRFIEHVRGLEVGENRFQEAFREVEFVQGSRTSVSWYGNRRIEHFVHPRLRSLSVEMVKEAIEAVR